jgi:beta-mannanase
MTSADLSTSQKIPFYGTILNNSTSQKVMLGAWLGEEALSATQLQTAIPNWEISSGKGLAWYAIMTNFGPPSNPQPLSFIDSYKPLIQQDLFNGVIYTWQPSYDSNWDQPNGTCTSQIASGVYDTYIRQEANRCKIAAYPIIIRWGHEMNSYWAGWATNAETYKQAWRHVVDIFRNEGATNVKFFWCPNYNDNPWDGSRNFELYYPGDNYVDYVGIDAYANNDYSLWANAEIQIGNNGKRSVYNTYTNKPYIIGEWGCSNAISETDNANWMTSLFNAIENRSRIIAAIHWRGNQDGWRVDLHPQAFAIYKTRTASDLYITNLIS